MATPAHAVVLTAGLGTRLRPLTMVRAKPALPVAGEPLARRIVRWLTAGGVTRLVLNLHHLPQTITARLGDGSDLGATIRYSWEQPQVLGSAGGPRRALPILGAAAAETFFIVNGDTLTDLDLAALAADHQRSGAVVTLALVENTEPDKYGGVRLDDRGAVLGFVPRGTAARGSYHFIGVQAASAAAFAGVPDNTPVNSIGGVYDRLIAARPGSLRGFVSRAAFHDIGTVADYWTTSMRLASVPSDVIVWDDVVIEDGAVVERCIVTDGVRVPRGAVYRGQILLRGEGGAPIAQPLTA